MTYTQFKPDPILSPYIDAYWVVTGSKKTNDVAERIMPDGCIDIILNLGKDFHVETDGNFFLMKNRHAYLVGTMTRYKEITCRGPRDTNLVGIRFKPAAFSLFSINILPCMRLPTRRLNLNKNTTGEINEGTPMI